MIVMMFILGLTGCGKETAAIAEEATVTEEKIVVRHQGGTEGGYSELTEAGKELLRKYDSFVEESTAAVNQIYKKIFDTKEE